MAAHNTHEHNDRQEDDASAHLSQEEFAPTATGMDDLPQILLKILHKQRWSQADLARELNVTQPTISRIINGAEAKYENRLQILALARRLTVINNSDVQEGSRNRRNIAVRATIGAAGEMRMLENPLELVPTPPLLSAETAAAAKVIGNGMLPMFSDGWIIYWDQAGQMASDSGPEALVGKLCVVCLVGGAMYVRKLIQGRRKGRYDLWAANTEPLLDQALVWAAKVEWIMPG